MMTRRECLLAGGALLGVAAAQRPSTKIGVELGCIEGNKWTPYQFLDYFKKVGISAPQFSAATLGVKPPTLPTTSVLIRTTGSLSLILTSKVQ
jgi:hypothetical protein